MVVWTEGKRVDIGDIVRQLIAEGWTDNLNGKPIPLDPSQLNIGLIALQRDGDNFPSPETLNYNQLIQKLSDRILETLHQYQRLVVEFIGLDLSGKTVMREKVVQNIEPRSGPMPAYFDLSGYLLPREERIRQEITPYHPEAFNAIKAGDDIQTLLERGRVEIPDYKNGRVEGSSVVIGDFVITDEPWSLHLPFLDNVAYLFFYALANDALRLERKRERDRTRYHDPSFIYTDFLWKVRDFLAFLAPRVQNLANIAVETSNLPDTVTVYTFRDNVLLPQTR